MKPTDSSQSASEIFSQTLATLVLYNTSLVNSVTFQSLSLALEKAQIMMDILIYDNSSSDQAMPTSSHWNIHYIHNAKNPGVGAAYNSGFELAKKLGKNRLLLLDQDTNYSISTLSDYTYSIEQYPDQVQTYWHCNFMHCVPILNI